MWTNKHSFPFKTATFKSACPIVVGTCQQDIPINLYNYYDILPYSSPWRAFLSYNEVVYIVNFNYTSLQLEPQSEANI